MSDEDRLVESGEDFEVYERKTRRPDADANRRDADEYTALPGKTTAEATTSRDETGHAAAGSIRPMPDRPVLDAETTDDFELLDRHDDDPERERELVRRAWAGLPVDTPPQAADEPPAMQSDEGHAPEAEPEATAADAARLPDPPATPMRVSDEASPRPTSARSTTPPSASSLGRFTDPAGTAQSADIPGPATTAPRSAPPSDSPRGNTMRIAIAATEFNYDIVNMMVERARAHAQFLGAEVTHTVRVPGTYDLPYAVQRLMRRDDVDGVVTLGVVIEGETDHDDLVIQHAARKIIDLSLEHGKPAGLGITGPGMSRLQAEARIDRAKDAVEAIVKLHKETASL